MISIIIPVYNRAHFIVECLESVFAQTYKDYEVIVVDDGSTDNLTDVLSPYIDRIRYIYKANGGVSSARNEGIRAAKGDYIAWLDSDDQWLPFKLELQMAVFANLPADIGFIFSDFSCMDVNSKNFYFSYIREYYDILDHYNLIYDQMFHNRILVKHFFPARDKSQEEAYLYWGSLKSTMIYGPMFLPSSIIITKKCLDSIGLFNEHYRSVEDYDFHARAAKLYDIAYVNLPTLVYRRFHADQLSTQEKAIEKHKNLLDIAIELGIKDREYYMQHRSLVNRVVGKCSYALGVEYFKKKFYSRALDSFLKSIGYNVRQRRVYLYLAACLAGIIIRSDAE
jgi:glycosyltransferase involved in cell wall biosynthesis